MTHQVLDLTHAMTHSRGSACRRKLHGQRNSPGRALPTMKKTFEDANRNEEAVEDDIPVYANNICQLMVDGVHGASGQSPQC